MTKAPRKTAPRRKKGPFTIVIARGDHIRHFTIRPWLLGATAAVAVAATAASVTAAGYAIFRDDLMSAALARQARLQQGYESRIATLRTQIDHITSQQALDQELMRRKVGELMERQEQLVRRQDRLSPPFGYAVEPTSGETVPVPSPRPDIPADQALRKPELDPVVTGNAYAAASHLTVPWPVRGMPNETASERANRFFVSMSDALREIERQQVRSIETLAEDAYQVNETLANALETVGITVKGEENAGGPFIPLPDDMPFDEKVQELDSALAAMEELTQTARRLPLASPVTDAIVTSGYGMRRDPILGRRAYHSGVDFRASLGAPIRAGGPGKVVKVGRNGGYGRMVEIDHGNGLTSRYAHLSKILVRTGEEVDTDTIVGHSGSSGRSTGPHLHYELRRNGKPTSPMKFIEAGHRVKDYL